ncbi:MAG: LexA family protein [Gammaproteobacteria bacterium]
MMNQTLSMPNTTPNLCGGQRILPFTDHPIVLSLPLFSGKVSAGYPMPTDDRIEKSLDLNKLLVRKPMATYFVRAEGDSMIPAGIYPNDILIVDRTVEPVHGKIVICALNEEPYMNRSKRHADRRFASGFRKPGLYGCGC